MRANPVRGADGRQRRRGRLGGLDRRCRYWGTIEDLYNVADMYRAGQIRPEIERYSMDDALEAYRRLESGELSGRAVVTPHA